MRNPRCSTRGVARTVAPPSVNSVSRSSVANVGRSVANCWYVRSFWSGSAAAFFNSPWMELPRAKRAPTFLLVT